MNSPRDPLESLHAAHEALAALGIPHGLIGGWAVIAWGRVRATRDIDWLASIPRGRKREIVQALSHLGAVDWREPGEDDPIAGLDFEDARALLQVQTGRLDEEILREACASRSVLDRLALLRR